MCVIYPDATVNEVASASSKTKAEEATTIELTNVFRKNIMDQLMSA